MRQDNIAMFQDTMEILNQGYYKIGDESRKLKLTREQMEAARVFLPEDIEAISSVLPESAVNNSLPV